MDRSFEDITVSLGTGAGTASDEILVADRAFGTIQFPAAFTGSKVVIEGQNVASGTWGAVLDSSGTQLEVTFSADAVVRIPDAAFGCSKLQFKSDGNEASARELYVHLES